jgi:hypothetical protein
MRNSACTTQRITVCLSPPSFPVSLALSIDPFPASGPSAALLNEYDIYSRGWQLKIWVYEDSEDSTDFFGFSKGLRGSI